MAKKYKLPLSLPNPTPAPPGWPEPLAPKAFYGLAGEVIDTIKPYTESDPGAVLLQLLAAFGNACGTRPNFVVERTRHGANIYVGIVGETAKARKGSSWSNSGALVAEVDPNWGRSSVQSGLSSGEGLIQALRDRGGTDSEIADKRILFFESDLARTFRVMGRQGNTLSEILRQAWDGGTLRVVTRHLPLVATNAHVSVVGQTTIADLKFLSFTDIANGFGNRILWFCARRQQLLPDGGEPPKANIARIRESLEDALNFARRVGNVEFTKKTKERWRDEYQSLTADVAGQVGSITARAEAQVRRLAMIYALMNKSPVIKLQHLVAALELWRYCFDSAAFVFGRESSTKFGDKVLQVLSFAPLGLTRTQITGAFHNHDTAAVSAALQDLLTSGRAKSVAEKTQGRNVQRWFLTDIARTS